MYLDIVPAMVWLCSVATAMLVAVVVARVPVSDCWRHHQPL
jgi:hypothetical protein